MRRFFWRRLGVRDRERIAADIARLRQSVERHEAFALFDLKRARELFGKLGKQLDICKGTEIAHRNGSHLARLRECEKSARKLAEGFAALQGLSTRWWAETRAQKASIADLEARSSAIPGRLFQRDVENYQRAFERESSLARKGKERSELQAHLDGARRAAEVWSALVEKAEASRVGLDQLKAELEAANQLDVAQDVVAHHTFQSLTDSLPRIRELMNEGNYLAAHNVMRQSQQLFRDLRDAIELRYRHVSEEISLWRQVPSVAGRFELSGFPESLTAEHIVRWRALCPEIEAFIDSRASNVRTTYGSGLASEGEDCEFGWPPTASIGDLDKLKALQTTVMRRLDRALPGETKGESGESIAAASAASESRVVERAQSPLAAVAHDDLHLSWNAVWPDFLA